MDKIKLNRILFEFMEKMTEECQYNYEQFIHELSRFVERFYNSYYSHNFCHYKTLKEEDLAPYFRGDKKEETLEKLLKAYILGYEEEADTYTIVLFEECGFKSVLWELHGGYEISEEHDYVEMEGYKKSFTKAEILNKFPKLWPLAQKNK